MEEPWEALEPEQHVGGDDAGDDKQPDGPQPRAGEQRRGAATRRAHAPGPHAVAEPAHRFDGPSAELAAQPGDEDLDRVRVAIVIALVDVLDQLGLRHHALAMVHQVSEDAQLEGGQAHRHAVAR